MNGSHDPGTTMARRALLLCVGSLLLLAGAFGRASGQGRDPLDLLRSWIKSVREHEPGAADAAALSISRWPLADMRAAIGEVTTIEHLLAEVAVRDAKAGRAQPFMYNGHAYTMAQFKTLLQLPPDDGLYTHPNQLLEHGAMLHTDIAMLVQPPPAPANQPQRPARTMSSVHVLDGQVLAVGDPAVHWLFARDLLDEITPDPGHDEFVLQWYRATSAWQASQLRWDDSSPHLRRARALFPADARILFYSGVMSEVFATPAIQAALEAANRAGLSPAVDPKQQELSQAEAFLRRAATLEPDFAEAHLRLGRVLGVLGRHEEAVGELTQALSGSTDYVLRYYAQLFLGNEEGAFGNRERARDWLEHAAAAFPTAQSPLLALSQLARQAGDAPAATAALARLQALTGRTDRVDPWWSYGNAHARNAEELMSRLRLLLKTEASW